MTEVRIARPLAKALRVYAGLALAIVSIQLVGLVMYLVNYGVGVAPAQPGMPSPSTTVTLLLAVAVVAGFTRAFVWIGIYWRGARVFSMLDEDSPSRGEELVSGLDGLTRLLVSSFVLDLLYLPAYFLSDVFLPFPLAGWRLGVMEVARLIFPQAFGVGALILAFLSHQYGRLLEERQVMKTELELTV